MLEQEIASAIKYILENTGNPAPYYYNIPQDFVIPAVYFPKPEIVSGGDTLNSYVLTYTWFIKFFHKDTAGAHEMALSALNALQFRKNLIPLIDENGDILTGGQSGKKFRIKDPKLKIIDDGTAQLTLIWDSIRPYYRETTPKMMKYYLTYVTKSYTNAINIINLDETECLTDYGK